MLRASPIWALALCLVLSGCAASPSDVGASYVSPVSYRTWTCQDLSDEFERVKSALAVAADRQDNARANDAVGVVLIGLPLGSLSGQGVAPEIGRLKDELQALHHSYIQQGCK